MKRYIDNGSLRFVSAYEFSHMQEENDKIADKYEDSLFYPVSKIYTAPLLSDDENGAVYGKPFTCANGDVLKIAHF